MFDPVIGFDPYIPSFRKHACPASQCGGHLAVERLPSGNAKVYCTDCDWNRFHNPQGPIERQPAEAVVAAAVAVAVAEPKQEARIESVKDSSTMAGQIKTCSECGAQKQRLCPSGMCRRCDAAEQQGRDGVPAKAAPIATPSPIARPASIPVTPASPVVPAENKLKTAERLAALLKELDDERESHVTAIREIDAMYSMLGITRPVKATTTEKPSATRRSVRD